MKRIILKPGEERRILAGHPWVYVNEAAAVLEGPGKEKTKESGLAKLTAGECSDVEGVVRGKPLYLGRAIVNPASRIIARIYSGSKEGLDKGFFKRRIREALLLRREAGYDLSKDSARVVFGEADRLPGLIIDRFVGRPADNSDANEPSSTNTNTDNTHTFSWLVIQFLAYGMDCRREMILQALEEIFGQELPPPAGIIEKSAPVRELEGLPLEDSVISGSFPAGGIVITENNLHFTVDLPGGQKTGHFLDQKNNRRIAGKYAARFAMPGEESSRVHEADTTNPRPPFRVLDCFCYTGGFGITAGRAAADALRKYGTDGSTRGQAAVTAVDVSAAALDLARKNAVLNGLCTTDGKEAEGKAVTLRTVEADAFDYLRHAERRKEKFNLIILDPPAFAKNHAALENAARGYKEINLRAIKLLASGGILVSCSCSHAMDEGRFKRIITGAAADAERRLIQLDFRYQAPDHPVLVGYDESLYLKCGFYRVL